MPSEFCSDSPPQPPASFNAALLPATLSDNPSCVSADPKTVMAEQSGHNVVSNSQSTGGSPLVDIAATTPTTDAALSGTQPPANAETTSARPEFSKSAADPPTDDSLAGSDATKNAAEPSAGDAAIAAVDDHAHPSANHVDGKSGAGSDLVNGIRDDASQGDVRDDRSNADVSVDVSINSDTDNSRGDASEKKDGHHHTRTNSVKKPTTFSKITATKNFMNKIAPAAPVAPKVGEKPSPVAAAIMQPSSRPRLVAKTGASLASLQSKRTGEGPTGPDASKVWNKNRPVQPPPPKQFTDEELKQQYGIHLATRLQTDEGGKESKWADIDDDEDDWAPETVVWMDGTKSSITPQDAVPSKDAQPEQKPEVPQPAKPAEGTRPTLSLKSSRPEQAMKILKPGVAAIQAKQNEQSPALASGDKPSLKAKSPAPAPAKSPWAPVPKVDSVSPINPPIQQQPPVRAPLATQDARAYDQSQPLPAREIAADTFDRSWRDGEGGTRELFNSTNGRYEPAPEGRRSSIKPDSSFRKPAVLQRPSAASPAEPSAAFQSRTSSQMDGGWGRRRGSSVSQGSMPPGRRMSMNQRPELSGTPEAPQDMRSPRSARGEPVKPTFPQQSVWDQQMPPQPEEGAEIAAAPQAEIVEPAPPMEDALKVQERVMREKRELAKKRRQEEEERAETEKQERLKAKLAALEGAGKSKKEREAEAAAAAAAAKEAREKEANAAPATDAKPSQPEPAHPAEASASTAASLESQSLPPAPGQAPQKPAPLDDKLPAPFPPKPQPAGLPERPTSNEQQKQTSRGPVSPRAAGRAPYQQSSAQYKTPASSYSSPGDRKPQPAFGRSPNLATDTFSPWPVTGPSSSVWGTSGIGNGTFDSSSAFAPLPMSQQASSLLPPPGMPRASGSTRISPQGFNQESRSPSLQPQQVAEQQRAFPPPGMESRPDPFAGQARLNGVPPAPGIGRQVPHPPGPIGPPSRTQAQSQQPQQPVQRPDPISAWNSATQSLPAQYAANQVAAQERRAKELSQPLPQPQASEARFKETFKKTSADQGALGGPRRYESTEYTVHDKHGSRPVASHSPAPPSTQTQPSAPFPTNSPAQWKASNESAVRIPDGSQNPAHGGSHAQQPPIGTRSVQQAPVMPYQSTANFTTAPLPPATESKDQSPPPPETESHPVNQGGDSSHPHVKLPRPQAKVKLPPASPSSQAAALQQNSSVLMPQRPPSNWGPPGAARPIVMNEAWQARFNGLFNRTAVQTETPPSPPRTPPKAQGPALAVASSSRAQLDEQSGGATVSLPPYRGVVADPGNLAVTKPSIDEMFNEELSFGSMPKVRVPRGVHYDTSTYSSTAKNLLQFPNSRMQRPVDTMTQSDLGFWKHPEGIFVTVPGTRLNNKLCMTPGAPERQPRHDQDRKPFIRFNKREKGDKGGYAQGNHATSEWPTNDGSKKSGYQKPYRQPSNNGASAEVKEGQSASNSERRKPTWGKSPRGGRHTSGAPPSAPVKSG
ncbi:hypothetical protein M409DRAFT_27163 [Zasmidium cellare ATCC 36951]|uniref:Uncharacterized protein n=1 Tax=Zasmidium cellare ATCC 36951 TaxID=1080233 RepID=A0A6A6C661_ZASCE|nr:uncharacterized protein M409DRAFT_27163 [Zasmidium cellare ATCC 36951]KAF2162541.1 hypothetical protein M409DRAFT_27163 [Zasmidium cellare ATCC 36951]